MHFLKFDNHSDAAKEITDRWGGYNYFPPLWKDVTDDTQQVEVIKRYLTDVNFFAIESRQMHYPEELKVNGCYVGATLFFTNSNNGFAIGKVYNREKFIFEDHYYVFGCRHINHLGKEIGRCYYGYTCQDCGHYWTVDSSD